MRGKIFRAGERAGEAAERWRVWLRRVMPRVAMLTPVLLIVWLLASDAGFDRSGFVARMLGAITTLVISLTVVYYGLRTLFWLKRKLLWRVRRRLMITYLFIGLTPVVLLGLLGLLSALIGLGQAMTRIVAVQVSATEKQTLASARALADSFARLPPNAGERDVQAWLDERTALLQGSLPGVRAALWRGGNGAAGAEDLGVLGQNGEAQLVSGPEDERTRGVGEDALPFGASLPGWLERRAEWSGFAFLPPRDAEQPFGTPSVRALVRRDAGGRKLALLLVVPVSRALVEHYHENAGMRLRPFFLGADELEARAEGNQVSIQVAPERAEDERADEALRTAQRVNRANFNRDQFGEAIQGQRYVVVLPATNWLDGETALRLSFMISLSWTEAGQQLFGNTEIGKVLKRVLIVTAVCFLFLELLALFAAAWMTRAVTGTVHKLYRATEFIRRGDFSHRVRVRSRDQLGELAQAFNEMSANIESLLNERVVHERLEREVEIAAEVQAQLFPRSVPRLATLEIAGECRAARGVAGDYYDYIAVAPGLYAFALGDVSGKGLSASLVMSNLQASLRAQTTIIAERLKNTARTLAATTNAAPLPVAVAQGNEPYGAGVGVELPCGVTGIDDACAVENMVGSINVQLCRSTDANRFATLFLALYDEPTRQLRYTNAGHNAPLLVRASGSLERLDAGGTVVGAFDWSHYTEADALLEPGDLLLIFSDGISEAQNLSGQEYGEERLAQFALARRHLSADDLRQAVFQEIDNWSDLQERGDDQTLVILKAVEAES
ncbi:MAG TPA: SpoIIE family protein phosphatase [Pyrinomonadaceae bacterium]|nr:SpoIIE family protein phosphatase [Pyrinomonadaceae bacterium]